MTDRKEPPFFNDDRVGGFHHKIPLYDPIELFIETLTGTCFELRVLPFEAVISVKAKIQRLEGIPVTQQHLIWNNLELDDDHCLHDYGIAEGCTLKLVLAMRGGPINTRRVTMEDPVKEAADSMEGTKEEGWEKTPANKQVTFVVYREGDQLNFFRVVDRGDGSLTPLSESLRSAFSAAAPFTCAPRRTAAAAGNALPLRRASSQGPCGHQEEEFQTLLPLRQEDRPGLQLRVQVDSKLNLAAFVLCLPVGHHGFAAAAR